jgi:hypothetical protein
LSEEEILLRAAVIMGSCMQDDGINRHLTRLLQPAWYPGISGRLRSVANCVGATGGGCGAVKACLGYAVTLSSETQCAPCQGEVAVYCGNGVRASLDCSALGFHCDPVAVCADRVPVVACATDGDATCTAEGRPRYCDDGWLQDGADCAALGLVCIDGGCSGQGAACSQTFAGFGVNGIPDYQGVECAGSVIRSCIGGRVDTRDCGELGPGYTCQVVEEGSPSCIGSCPPIVFCGLDDECVPGEQPPATSGSAIACEGAVVRFCHAGRVARVDCRELGFVGCQVGQGSYGCTE